MRIELALLRYRCEEAGSVPHSSTDHRPVCSLAPAILLRAVRFSDSPDAWRIDSHSSGCQSAAPEGPTSRRTVFES